MRLPLRDAWKDWHVAVRVLTGTGHDQHMRSIFCQLHCLLVCFWIPFKVLFLTFKCKPWSRSEISFQFQLLLSGGRLGVTRPSGLLPCGYEILYLLKSDPSWSSWDLFHRIYVSFTWTLGPGWTFLFLSWLSSPATAWFFQFYPLLFLSPCLLYMYSTVIFLVNCITDFIKVGRLDINLINKKSKPNSV